MQSAAFFGSKAQQADLGELAKQAAGSVIIAGEGSTHPPFLELNFRTADFHNDPTLKQPAVTLKRHHQETLCERFSPGERSFSQGGMYSAYGSHRVAFGKTFFFDESDRLAQFEAVSGGSTKSRDGVSGGSTGIPAPLWNGIPAAEKAKFVQALKNSFPPTGPPFPIAPGDLTYEGGKVAYNAAVEMSVGTGTGWLIRIGPVSDQCHVGCTVHVTV